ncbi:GspE/PulE family protein [Roseimaritima ulvae]|uniref:Type II/IV secretion system protein n=1 Tax=Roseimaritima ulvae TaxID=980254 RepID=A0A5B9QU06_9BACT|nr:ATPase, T2SS/T4P/T4SS family [Roseimaritima ulvae]QEG40526.1 Type II/IV secretion system protein [Roseimaritima ulvae]
MAVRRIGQILVDLGFLTDEQLEAVLQEQQQQPGALLGQIAESMGLITDEQLVQGLAEQMRMKTISLSEVELPPEVLEKISETMAQLYRVVPVKFEGNTLTIATCDPQNLTIQDELRTFLGYDIQMVVTTEREILQTIGRFYDSESESVEKLVSELAEDDELKSAIEALESEKFNLTDAEALADSAPVRKLLNMVLLLAIKDHASDVHFEPFEDEFRIRIKAEGVLYEMVPPPRHLAFAITTRIKVMANLDIAERRMPQDGRIELMLGGHPVDLRVSVLPTIFGESVVMRILDRSVVDLSLENVGMDDFTVNAFRKAIDRPNGIVLVTGPTGSGKTTTLYSALTELNDPEDKLITTEDPVEYDIEGIIQIPIDTKSGVTFASCLRAILRQDPDTILVGEIRDLETAEIAIQAALTGHLVFSTLHTNDSAATVTRLKDMGIQTFMICATVEAILAQRLVRRVCTKCREEIKPSNDMLFELGLEREDLGEKKFYRGAGCDACNNTGYKGRVGLFELMVMNDTIRELVMRNASTDEIRDQSQKDGMITLRDFGMRLAEAGITSLDEVVRETIQEA